MLDFHRHLQQSVVEFVILIEGVEFFITAALDLFFSSIVTYTGTCMLNSSHRQVKNVCENGL